MNYLKIKNNGIIDPKSLYLMGASTKRGDDNKIGMFGSGNKYSLAYLLRNNYQLSIFAGLNEISLSKKVETLRDKEFETMYVNDTNTNITTELGKDWSLWQALREIYCNAMDEGGHEISLFQNIEPKDNETHFYIKSKPEINNFIARFDDYFAQNKEVLFENQYGKIYAKHSEDALIYRKGVKCTQNLRCQSLYDYDLPNIEINEDRIVKHSWQIEEMIWKLLFSCDNETVIRNLLVNLGEESNIECQLKDYQTILTSSISDTFIKVMKEYKIAPKNQSGYLKDSEKNQFLLFPSKIYAAIKSYLTNENMAQGFKILNGNDVYRPVEISELQRATLNKAVEFLTECNQTEPLKWNIDFGLFSDSDVRGMADVVNGKIIISPLTLDSGANYTIEVLLEEHIHLKYRVTDETRAFQDAVIKEWINTMKMHNAFLV